MNIVGTPYSAVQRSASTRFEHALRLERLAGKNHRRAVRHAAEHAHHHAEAVIQRHGNAQAVVLA